MEKEKELYPLKFTTLEDKYEWGKEEFKLADLGYRDSYIREGWLAGNLLSEVMDMYMDSVVGENVFGLYGRQFPFQIKTISVNGKMPLRVHPDDTTAADRYDALGKDKIWIVTKAGKDARFVLGFDKDASAGDFYTESLSGDVEKMMNVRPVREGEYFIIPSGTPHAALGELTILEISESSALDFCLCGWGNPVSSDEFDESLTIDSALDFINYRAWKEPDSITQFTVRTISLKESRNVSESDSCSAYYCVRGGASFRIGDAAYSLEEDRVILIPADIENYVIEETKPDTELIEVYLEKREEKDSYLTK